MCQGAKKQLIRKMDAKTQNPWGELEDILNSYMMKILVRKKQDFGPYFGKKKSGKLFKGKCKKEKNFNESIRDMCDASKLWQKRENERINKFCSN